jgi:hypothetical protein
MDGMNRKQRRRRAPKGHLDNAAFLKAADKFIDVANRQNARVKATELHMAFLYASARYSAYVAKAILDAPKPRGLREGDDGALSGDAAPASCRPVFGQARKRLNASIPVRAAGITAVPFLSLVSCLSRNPAPYSAQPVRSMTGHASRSAVLLLAHMGGLPSQV